MKDRDNRNLQPTVGTSSSSSRRASLPVDRGDALSPPSQPAEANSQPPTRVASTKAKTALPESLQTETPAEKPSRRLPLPQWLVTLLIAWQFWALVVLVGTGASGYWAANALLKLPALPSCPTLFLPFASGSVRLYCAQIEADKQTTEGYLAAIRWVEILPKEHALRGEVDRKIEEWSLQILDLVDETVQSGYLEQAIADARRIPKYVEAYKFVEERIAKWQATWSKANKIVLEAEKLMLDSKWALAFREASKLTTLKNRYWGTTRYNGLVEKIRLAQEESAKLDKAYALVKRGGTKNLFQAIKLAEEIKPDSTARREADKLIAEAGEKLLTIAVGRLESGDWSGAKEIASRLPAKFDASEEIGDLNSLADAGARAGTGNIDSLQAAIDAAKAIQPGRPLYEKAQRLIGRWQLEIQDVQTLARAEELANGGDKNYLQAAIAKARLIPRSHPRYSEARNKIAEWSRQLEALERPPVVARYDRDAETTAEVQRAIQETRSLPVERPADPEPLSDRRFEQPAPSAFVPVERPLQQNRDNTVQRESTRVVSESRDRLELDRARQMARGGTSSALSSAIRIAQQVSDSSPLYNQSLQEMNSWSERILAMAQERSGANLSDAIETARKIPSGTSAYPAARTQIEVWQQQLRPQIPASPPQVEPPQVEPPQVEPSVETETPSPEPITDNSIPFN